MKPACRSWVSSARALAVLAGAAAAFAVSLAAHAQGSSGPLRVPATIEAGQPFTVGIPAGAKGSVTLVGPAGVVRRDADTGADVSFAAGALGKAGHYTVIFAPQPTGTGSPLLASLDVLGGPAPASISFLAKPSRLPVAVHDGITGAAYLFDAYGNLVTAPPVPVAFTLATGNAAPQTRTAPSRFGVAWTAMDSGGAEGAANFRARAGSVLSTRVIQQVPGEPCALHVATQGAAKDGRVTLATEPVRDCRGNAVPDGTVVTFTETYNRVQTTVDAPLKRGVATVSLPMRPGARITVASGVVLGNEVHL